MLCYFPDAVNPAPTPFVRPATQGAALELRIMGATGHGRYTQRLAGVDLSRVLYVYGFEDRIVGRLSDEEERFLTARGARVMAVYPRFDFNRRPAVFSYFGGCSADLAACTGLNECERVM